MRTQQDMGALARQGALGQGVESALNADVDHLLLRVPRAGQGQGAVVHGQQGLDEAHGHVAGRGVEEEQGVGVPVRVGGVRVGQAVAERQDAIPAGPLLGLRTAPQDAHAQGRVNVLPVDEEVGRCTHVLMLIAGPGRTGERRRDRPK